MTIKKRHLILAIFIILTSKGFSQANKYINGYVIKESKDTIFGKLKKLSKERSCLKIKFIDSNGNKVKFKDRDVYAYKRGSELFFKKSYVRPFSISNMKGYMKLVVDGKVKLFQFNYVVKNAGNMNSSGVMMGGGTSYLKDYYIEKNNSLLLVRKLGFKNKMSEYFSDNADLADKIKNKDLKFRDIYKIIRIYNTRDE